MNYFEAINSFRWPILIIGFIGILGLAYSGSGL